MRTDKRIILPTGNSFLPTCELSTALWSSLNFSYCLDQLVGTRSHDQRGNKVPKKPKNFFSWEF